MVSKLGGRYDDRKRIPNGSEEFPEMMTETMSQMVPRIAQIGIPIESSKASPYGSEECFHVMPETVTPTGT